MKRFLIIFLVAVMLSTTACNNTNVSEQTEGKFFRSEDSTFEVVTPYCILKYPEKWENAVETNVEQSDSMYAVSYYAKFDTVKIPLFVIGIGEGFDGFVLGTIETKDGLKTVYMDDCTNDYDGTLSSEDEELYMEMCEDVNVIISSLVYDYGMLLP